MTNSKTNDVRDQIALGHVRCGSKADIRSISFDVRQVPIEDIEHQVAAICVRLDGLPLAIELAATRVNLFTPQELLTRLDRRFALLTAGALDLPPRQQTLRRAIDWSYALLDAGRANAVSAAGRVRGRLDAGSGRSCRFGIEN